MRSGYCYFEYRHIENALIDVIVLLIEIIQFLFNTVVHVCLENWLTYTLFPQFRQIEFTQNQVLFFFDLVTLLQFS